jgi:hypothetical protein
VRGIQNALCKCSNESNSNDFSAITEAARRILSSYRNDKSTRRGSPNPLTMKTASFNETVCFAAAAFTGKLMINKILIARARMGSGTPAWGEDSLDKLGLVGTAFKYLLVTFGPLVSKGDVARLSGLEANSGECEPAFLLAAAAYGYTFASPPAYAANLVLAAVTSRFLHAFFFVIVPAQPWRAFSFLVPTAITLYFSTEVITAYRSS